MFIESLTDGFENRYENILKMEKILVVIGREFVPHDVKMDNENIAIFGSFHPRD